MKIWIVKIGTNSRTFFDEMSFNAWLTTTTDSVSNRVVEVYEATPVERRTVKEIKDSIKDANIRESRIQAVVSTDPWFSKYENFKAELVKYPNTNWLIEKLNMLDDKKFINKYLKSQKEFLLCEITDEVQWFELLIDFLDIKEMVDGFYQKISGYNTRVRVSNKRKENFLKAQKNVQKAV
jgi:hypothetical protein